MNAIRQRTALHLKQLKQLGETWRIALQRRVGASAALK